MLESLEENARDCGAISWLTGHAPHRLPSLHFCGPDVAADGRSMTFACGSQRHSVWWKEWKEWKEAGSTVNSISQLMVRTTLGPPVELSQISEPYNYQCVIEHYRTKQKGPTGWDGKVRLRSRPFASTNCPRESVCRLNCRRLAPLLLTPIPYFCLYGLITSDDIKYRSET
ncbi:hypothetical protein DTO166G4_2750 [Paecilomyces variotii]|nr:hypothetical protein DTO166G4_2750 [Paecilomyces variotii]KAJ9233111.1 hypothetical protein DTO166G5_5908 [Paecilomyces variotii]